MANLKVYCSLIICIVGVPLTSSQQLAHFFRPSFQNLRNVVHEDPHTCLALCGVQCACMQSRNEAALHVLLVLRVQPWCGGVLTAQLHDGS